MDDNRAEGLPSWARSVDDVASWAAAEVAFTGADVSKHLPRPMQECSPFEIVGACLEALDEGIASELKKLTGVTVMTKERFVAICVEETLTFAEAGDIWDYRHEFSINTEDLTEDMVRATARAVAPAAAMLRKYLRENEL